MQINYISEKDCPPEREHLKIYRDDEGRLDFNRDEAEEIARRLHDAGNYVRIDFGSDTYMEFGKNPLRSRR